MGLDRFLLICPSGKNRHRNVGYGTPSPSLRGALATKQSKLCTCVSQSWIASRSLSSGARSRDPLARNGESGAGGSRSQKALRIDVDLELEIALCLVPRGQPLAQIF